ncbi:MAG: serine/threonine protein kinase [Lachnospiraceae bacterium]|nr:serine/threonine protein kinase [Lachnospiraceae bacterium]
MSGIVIAVLTAASIPSAIFAAYVRKMEKKMDAKEKAREEHEFLIIKSINASMALGEATAEAVARIPDAHCNGDMHAALDYAREVKHEQKDFLNRQAVHAIS